MKLFWGAVAMFLGAVSTANVGAVLTPPAGEINLKDLMTKFTKALLLIGGPILAIMILIGGFQIMTARGSEEQVTNGKKTIWHAVIGFVIILFAESVVLIIEQVFS